MYLLRISKKELSLKKIIQSGQVFHYEILGKDKYLLIFQEQYVIVEEVDSGCLFHCNEETFHSIWEDYFDLKRNYGQAIERIIQADPRMRTIISVFEGVRILRQEPFEMLMTFIVSQSKSILQIRKLVHELSERYGTYLGTVETDEPENSTVPIFQFPLPQQLSHLDEADFRALKFGYRAPYLQDAVRFATGDTFHDLPSQSDEQILVMLKSIKGVGNKVAACVMLFGYARMSVFPVDTWMRKIMLHLYSEKDIKDGFHGKDVGKNDQRRQNNKKRVLTDRDIEAYGKEIFGDDSGLAQQFLFEYGRTQINFKK